MRHQVKVRFLDRNRVEYARWEGHNLCVIEGGRDVAMLLATDKSVDFDGIFFRLVNDSGFTAFAVTDSLASHPGWTFWPTDWADWTDSGPDPASGGVISNVGAPAEILMSAGGVVRGVAVILGSNIGNPDSLWATIDFGSGRAVAYDEIVEVEYTVTLTAA